MAVALPSEYQFAHVRRVLLAGAAILLAYAPADLLYPGGLHAIAWRLGWSAALGLAAALQRPARPALARAALHAAGLACGLFGGAVVLDGGGTHGARFGFLLALGPAILLLVPDQPWTAFLGSAAAIAFGVGLMIREGRPAGFMVEWLTLATALGVLAAFGARWFRRLWLGQIRAERERALALERLAESERRRVEAERLAAVGRLAREWAHELSNAVAAVKSNLGWLREAGAAGPAGSPADADALGEAEGGVRRIVRLVDDARALAAFGAGAGPGAEASDVPALLASAGSLLQERGLPCSVEDGAGLPPVAADGDRLARALAHLAQHLADEAGPPGAAEPVRLAAARDGSEIVLSVAVPGAAPRPARGRKPASLSFSLALEFAAQGNGLVQALDDRRGFAVRVPAA